MKRICQKLACLVNVTIILALAAALYMQARLPDAYLVIAGENISFDYPITMVQSPQKNERINTGDSYQADLKLMGAIQVKTIEINVVDRKIVTVSGQPFGIKMFTDGLMVVGMSDIPCDGSRINPAKNAGVQVGDILLSMGNTKLTTNEQLGELVEANGSKPIQVRVRRGNHTFTTKVTPMLSQGDSRYRIGVWVRDSSAGIGTMTYYDANSGLFTGLGHAVCDVDTGDIMPLLNGEVLRAQITGYKKGSSGAPGELKGKFVTGGAMGTLLSNTTTGVYGVIRGRNEVEGIQMPLAMSHEVKTGKAIIYTTIDGNTPGQYEIEIEKVITGESGNGQNMVIRVTDTTLLEKTGGIVQGMSGSPIIQNGMLVGSVTHVFVNDPTRGFGIFAENIQNNAYNALNLIKAVA